jgi:hypothetical protein
LLKQRYKDLGEVNALFNAWKRKENFGFCKGA